MLMLSTLWVADASAEDAPEISRSTGTAGGTLVFWPRVIPRTDDPAIQQAAASVQAQLVKLVHQARPDSSIDIRPEPERVCPRAGCESVTIGALLVHSETACVVVGLVAGPGKSPATLVPWGGGVDLKQPTVPFRDYAESHIVVRDFAKCSDLIGATGPRNPDMVRAIQQATASQ